MASASAALSGFSSAHAQEALSATSPITNAETNFKTCPSALASMQPPARPRPRAGRVLAPLLEQLDQLVRHGACKLARIRDRHRLAIIARDVVTNADGDQLYGRTRFDLLDHLTQVLLQVVAGIDRKGGVVNRRSI